MYVATCLSALSHPAAQQEDVKSGMGDVKSGMGSTGAAPNKPGLLHSATRNAFLSRLKTVISGLMRRAASMTFSTSMDTVADLPGSSVPMAASVDSVADSRLPALCLAPSKDDSGQVDSGVLPVSSFIHVKLSNGLYFRNARMRSVKH